MPRTDQEYGGIIWHGAEFPYACCEATVPRVQVIMTKGYGGAYIVMDSKSIGTDLAHGWPSSEIAPVSPRGAAEVVHRRALANSSSTVGSRAELVEEYGERYANRYVAAERGCLDGAIDPADTRSALAGALPLLAREREETPRREHGNVAL
jgi:acetyl-CoA carboxylase carboxyltransferase component